MNERDLERCVRESVFVTECLYMCICRSSGSEGGQTLVARALYDFSAGSSDELTISTGDELVRHYVHLHWYKLLLHRCYVILVLVCMFT